MSSALIRMMSVCGDKRCLACRHCWPDRINQRWTCYRCNGKLSPATLPDLNSLVIRHITFECFGSLPPDGSADGWYRERQLAKAKLERQMLMHEQRVAQSVLPPNSIMRINSLGA